MIFLIYILRNKNLILSFDYFNQSHELYIYENINSIYPQQYG
jgi:hypothetical protein